MMFDFKEIVQYNVRTIEVRRCGSEDIVAFIYYQEYFNNWSIHRVGFSDIVEVTTKGDAIKMFSGNDWPISFPEMKGRWKIYE